MDIVLFHSFVKHVRPEYFVQFSIKKEKVLFTFSSSPCLKKNHFVNF